MKADALTPSTLAAAHRVDRYHAERAARRAEPVPPPAPGGAAIVGAPPHRPPRATG